MADSHGAVAHHFDDAEQQHEAASLGMWAFLVTEIMFFGGMFLAYTVYRSVYPDAFADASNHMDVVLGTVNTAVLIGSSLSVAMAVHAAHASRRKALLIYLFITIVLGAAFLGIKLTEYLHHFEARLVPGWNFAYEGADARHAAIFFSFYFTMTGMHAVHMVIGIVMFLVLGWNAWRGRYSQVYFTPVEMGGLYWHFVDIIWIFLFPLFYLVGRH